MGGTCRLFIFDAVSLNLFHSFVVFRYRKSEPRVPLTGQQLFEYRLPKSIHSQLPYGGKGSLLDTLDRCYSVSIPLTRTSRPG